jgi:hypothetical protein
VFTGLWELCSNCESLWVVPHVIQQGFVAAGVVGVGGGQVISTGGGGRGGGGGKDNDWLEGIVGGLCESRSKSLGLAATAAGGIGGGRVSSTGGGAQGIGA